ncbi:hypothetical protein LXT21_12810 [Myxococcus sp. K38C18041901]|uniref:hypothetical protein n=1 Tax=Myxococcus guangdongensis TaxID=2906760 RepID=UPI0020A7B862|nr:hypothetical protein [Myxococcus guangdongensis]MCP3059660.1 hypothetical protein [Myxococcus guangdongensis]
MYCPDCRQERLGQFHQCALCGTAMTSRPRSELDAELAHVHFLLSELSRWDATEVPPNVRRFLSERYERQARILLSVLAESPAPANRVEPLRTAEAVAVGAPSRPGEGPTVVPDEGGVHAGATVLPVTATDAAASGSAHEAPWRSNEAVTHSVRDTGDSASVASGASVIREAGGGWGADATAQRSGESLASGAPAGGVWGAEEAAASGASVIRDAHGVSEVSPGSERPKAGLSWGEGASGPRSDASLANDASVIREAHDVSDVSPGSERPKTGLPWGEGASVPRPDASVASGASVMRDASGTWGSDGSASRADDAQGARGAAPSASGADASAAWRAEDASAASRDEAKREAERAARAESTRRPGPRVSPHARVSGAGAEAHPLPEDASAPSFEAPQPRGSTARFVEQASSWSRVWKPFLYESIMWFVGAFLVLSGLLYFVFERWAGMSSVSRSMAIFLATAGASAFFSIMGAVLGRREALRGPGRILGVIGSAAAPLAGIALSPTGFSDASLSGNLGPWWLTPALLVWAAIAAWFVRKPADAFDAPSRPFVQASLVVSILMMGLAPVAARLGGVALWLNLVPCVLFFLLSRRSASSPREGAALAFALAAPLYLLIAYAVRLHLALVHAGTPPEAGIYAPLVAFLLASAHRFRALPAERAADTLSLGVVSLQTMCLVAAIGAPPPTFFVTAAVITWTLLSLASGALHRLPWVYPAYAALYFSYATSGQLVPGPLRRLLDALKASLGYPVADRLPVQYGALTALPFVLAGVVLAVSRLWRGERTGQARDVAFAEVLLRCTAVAGVLFSFYGIAGPDARPALWSVLGMSVVCLGTGLLVDRFYLKAVGALLMLVVPALAIQVLSVEAASVVVGVLALGLSGVSLVCTARTRALVASVGGLLATAGFLMGLFSDFGFTPLAGAVLCGASMLLIAWSLRNAYAVAYAVLLAAALVPKLALQVSVTAMAFSLVFVALALAVVAERGRLLRQLSGVAVFYALFGFLAGIIGTVSGLGVVMLLSAGAIAVVSRTFPLARPLAVFLAAFALLPDMGRSFSPWGGLMTPAMSMGAFILWALGSSLSAARWGRSPSTTVAALVAWTFPFFAVVEAKSWQENSFILATAFAALLTARAMPAGLSVGVAALYATSGLYSTGPMALLGLATVLAVLAVLEEVPAVLRVGAGGRRYAMVATVASALVMVITVVRWDDGHPAWMAAGAMVLPLLWTRATRLPYFACLGVPLCFVGFLAMGGDTPTWAYALPLLSLAVTRAVEHVPGFSALLLRSNEVEVRNRLSLGMQVSLALLTPVVLLTSWMGPLPVYFLTASLALMPGPMPFLRVCGASLLLIAVPEARPVVTVLLLALALAEHHVAPKLWAFFRSPPDAQLRQASVITALVIGVLPVLEDPSPTKLAGLAGVVAASAFLLSLRWLLVPSLLVLSLACVGRTESLQFLEWRPEAGLPIVALALGAAVLSAFCQSGGVQRSLDQGVNRLTPGLGGTWSEPLWAGSAGVLGLLLVSRLVDAGPGALAPHVALGAGAASLVLMATRERWMANVATALLGLSLVAAVPFVWLPAAVSGAGLVLCVAGLVLDARGVRVGAALHHGGWVMALLSLSALRELRHVGTPMCFLFGLGAAWTVVWRRREREAVGWLASLVAVHGVMMHLGAVYSTGRGSEFILPYLGALSALLAALALFVAGREVRRGVGLGFTVVALMEVMFGLGLLGPRGDALREALVACGALAVLLFALVRHASREEDEPAAFLAQAVLALGYLSMRMLGMGAQPNSGDSLAALVGGALFTGLYFFVQREGSGLAVFRRPALWGAYLFPMAGLLSAPWSEPLQVAALLVGHAAHFAALASHPTRRGSASLASVVAFNVALFLVWQGTGHGEPQFYVIPAGLSLLALLRVFRGTLEQDTYARLRAVAVTVIYVAGAWKPLMFDDGGAMLLCVFLCVVGVGFGIALRIRSYVYLGTAFLVTCVAANLVRFGMRDHRVAAASLFLMGLFVIGSMVMLSAHRAALLQRYTRVRALLSTWEG